MAKPRSFAILLYFTLDIQSIWNADIKKEGVHCVFPFSALLSNETKHHKKLYDILIVQWSIECHIHHRGFPCFNFHISICRLKMHTSDNIQNARDIEIKL